MKKIALKVIALASALVALAMAAGAQTGWK